MARQEGLPSLAGMSFHPPRQTSAPVRFSLKAVAAAALLLAFSPGPLMAQAPAAPVTAVAPMQAEQLEQLVAPIALYPDDLVAIILPASTNPLQIVQADRFLEQRKSNPKLELNAKWDDPIKTLCNYPDVVKKMSQDLDWTTQLGEAVVADTGEVLEAVQGFRRRAQAAGNLKSDDKQKVVVEQNVITIAPANPEVVYVPQYNPQTVVVVGAYPTYPYYPAPYPAYWYPYAPGAALAAGVIWGAAIGAAWSGGHYNYGGGNNTINIDRGDRNTTINRGGDRTNVASGNRSAQATQWKSDKKPGQVSGSVGGGNRAPRAGDTRTSGAGGGNFGGGAGGGAGGARPGAQPSGGVGGGAGGARPSTQPSGGFGSGAGSAGGARPSTQPAGGGGGFDGMGSARQTQMDSSRGASSRSSAGASAGRAPSAAPRSSAGGGGAARTGGGGGARGGGGGGRGGGGRR